jgi:hypothetical protein
VPLSHSEMALEPEQLSIFTANCFIDYHSQLTNLELPYIVRFHLALIQHDFSIIRTLSANTARSRVNGEIVLFMIFVLV